MKLHYEFIDYKNEENEKLKILNGKLEVQIKELNLAAKKYEEEIINFNKSLAKKEEMINELNLRLRHHEELIKTSRNNAPDYASLGAGIENKVSNLF
jgi:hypothetical protein